MLRVVLLVAFLAYAALTLAALSVASRQLSTPFFTMATATVVVAVLNLCGDFWMSSNLDPRLALASTATIYATLLFHIALVAFQLQLSLSFDERFYKHRCSVFAAMSLGLPAAPDALLVCVPWHRRPFLPDGFPSVSLLMASLVRPFVQDIPQLAFKAYFLRRAGIDASVLVSALGSFLSLILIGRRFCFFKEDRSHLLPPPPVVCNEDVELSEKAVSFAATLTTTATDCLSSPTNNNCWKHNDDNDDSSVASSSSSSDADGDVEDRRIPRYVSKRRIMTFASTSSDPRHPRTSPHENAHKSY